MSIKLHEPKEEDRKKILRDLVPVKKEVLGRIIDLVDEEDNLLYKDEWSRSLKTVEMKRQAERLIQLIDVSTMVLDMERKK